MRRAHQGVWLAAFLGETVRSSLNQTGLCFQFSATRGQASLASAASWRSNCSTHSGIISLVKVCLSVCVNSFLLKWARVSVCLGGAFRIMARRCYWGWQCSPQMFVGLPPVLWHLIPRWGHQGFWGSKGKLLGSEVTVRDRPRNSRGRSVGG